MAYSTPWYTDFRGEEVPKREEILRRGEVLRREEVLGGEEVPEEEEIPTESKVSPRKLAHRDLHLGNVLMGKFSISLVALVIDDDCRRFVSRRAGAFELPNSEGRSLFSI